MFGFGRKIIEEFLNKNVSGSSYGRSSYCSTSSYNSSYSPSRESAYPSCDYPENPARSQDSSRYQGYPVSQNPLEPNEITKVVSYFNRQVQDFDTYKLFICVQDPNSDRPVAVRTPSLLSPSDVLYILDNPDLFLVGTDITGTVSDSYYATEPRTIVVDHPSSKRRLDLSRLDEKGRFTITMPKYTVVARDDLSDAPLQGHNGPKTR